MFLQSHSLLHLVGCFLLVWFGLLLCWVFFFSCFCFFFFGPSHICVVCFLFFFCFPFAMMVLGGWARGG